MYFEVYGEGPPLLMLHGIGGSNQMWSSFIPDYKPHFKLILPDFRGHGRTNNPSKTFTHRQAAEDILLFLDHLGLEKVKAIGCSSGGDILLHMATIQPERIEKMVLDSCGPYFSEQTRQGFRDFTLTEERLALYRQRHHFGDDQIELLVKQIHDLKDSYDDVNFTKPLLSTIQAETLIVYGDRDRFYSVDLAVEMYESIPDSYLWVVPNSDHAIVMGERAEQVRKVVLDFFLGKWET